MGRMKVVAMMWEEGDSIQEIADYLQVPSEAIYRLVME